MPNISWSTTPNSVTSHLQVADNAAFTKSGGSTLLVDMQGIVGTSFLVNGLAAATTCCWRIRGQNTAGDGPWSATRSFTTAGAIAVEGIDGSVPSSFELYASYPNPFNPTTSIQFDVAAETQVRLSVFDALGRAIDVLVSERLLPGRYVRSWNAASQPSGLYIYRLEAGSFSKTGRMTLVK